VNVGLECRAVEFSLVLHFSDWQLYEYAGYLIGLSEAWINLRLCGE